MNNIDNNDNLNFNCDNAIPISFIRDVMKSITEIRDRKSIASDDYIYWNNILNWYEYLLMKWEVEKKDTPDKNIEPFVPMPAFYNHSLFDEIPEPCRGCSNHPSNGGSGICLCTLGLPKIT